MTEHNLHNVELITEAADRILLNEDIWGVIKWLLQKLGLAKKPSKFQDYKVVDVSRIRGHSHSGLITFVLRRTLSIPERKRLEVLPVVNGRKKLVVVKRDITAFSSDKLADQVVNYLLRMGGKEEN